MNDIDRRRYEMLARVRDFGATHGHLFPESTLAKQLFAEVATGVQEVDAQALTETSASDAARATRKLEARRVLVERLVLMRRTTDVMTDADAQFKANFQLPDSMTLDHPLLTAARKFVKHATPAAARFIAHGMAPTFLADLGALIDNFEAAVRDRGMSREEQAEARARIRASLAHGLAAARALDVIVANHLADNAVVRELWKRRRYIGQPPRARRSAVAQPSAFAEASTAGNASVDKPTGGEVKKQSATPSSGGAALADAPPQIPTPPIDPAVAGI